MYSLLFNDSFLFANVMQHTVRTNDVLEVRIWNDLQSGGYSMLECSGDAKRSRTIVITISIINLIITMGSTEIRTAFVSYASVRNQYNKHFCFVDWIRLAQAGVQRWALVITVMN
jgi:hypothetical protein